MQDSDSDTYLAILEEGQAKGSRKAIVIVGAQQFGPLDKPLRDELNVVTDLDRLERMLCRATKAASWQDILATP